MKGEPVTAYVEELRLFNLCSSMKWAHLPNAGGLYDQDPVLLERFAYIFSEVAKHEEAERKKDEAKNNKKVGKSGAGAPRSTRVRNR